MGRKRQPSADRLRAHLTRVGECLIWTGAVTGRGYGNMRRSRGEGNGNFATHRLAWELAYGPIPDGLVVDHLCENKVCCEPSHLQLVTQTRNAALYWERHPNVRGT